MKILLASSSSGSRGGGELFLILLGQGLVARGHEVTLWCAKHPRMNELAEKFSSFGKVFRSFYTNTYDRPLRCWGAAFDGFTAHRAAREWDALQPGIIHLNKQNLEDGIDLIRACSMILRPSVCTIHITQPASELQARCAGLRDWISWRQLVQYRGRYVAVSAARAKALAEFATLTWAPLVIHNGVAIPSSAELQVQRDSFRKKLELDPGDLLVLGVGRMVDQKRPLLFLRAAQNILRTNPKVRFVWLGDDGPVAAAWDRYVAENNLRENVRRLTWQDDVTRYLAAADLFIHPASFEGMPLALLEAMAAGLPCAITPGLARELPFLNEENVWLFDENNVDECPWPDENRRKNIALHARQLAQKEFSLERMIAEYESLYHTSIEELK
jgi:glycosyltransferase involved in cell wall biosynthesis